MRESYTFSGPQKAGYTQAENGQNPLIYYPLWVSVNFIRNFCEKNFFFGGCLGGVYPLLEDFASEGGYKKYFSAAFESKKMVSWLTLKLLKE